ncbi:MAG TPA: type 4a pilus biogenesis protein PilO [Acidimicrobiia bacterium]|jgi:Tfp pilus assembly protein PilO|nr:type 4a pilus biogenesis protein PilO [Acidimicrobiia bacterium]
MKTKNLAVGALAALLVTALWWNFLLKPSKSEAKKVKADTATEREKLAPLEAQLSKARLAQAHAATFKAQLTALQHAVPDSPALAEFIRDANFIADASRVSWQQVTHGPPALDPSTGVSAIPVGIQVKGTYQQVMDYLFLLKSLKRMVVVDAVQISSGGGDASTGTGASTGPFSGASQLSVTVTARMFEVPPETATDGSTLTGAATG